MSQRYASPTLEDAKQMLSAAEAEAASLGIPYCIDGMIVGAVGASAGTVEQNMAVAEAAITGLSHQAQSWADLRQPPSGTRGWAQVT
jgi:uncharacterized protein GlcG (DUF336 family)